MFNTITDRVTGALALAEEDQLRPWLQHRLGRDLADRRWRLERHDASSGFTKFSPLRWLGGEKSASLIRTTLTMTGMLASGQANTRQIRVAHHEFQIPALPAAFDGFRLLHLTDLHVDMDPANLAAVIGTIKPLEYDQCVLTGDYRSRTYGPVDNAIKGMALLREALQGEPLAVLGNHDSIRLLPAMEAMGFRLLMNENVCLSRANEQLCVAGVDDPHHFKTHDLEKAYSGIPRDTIRILLCHSPELWRAAMNSGTDVFLCGHTHGGQICLPGGIPLTLDADCPRALGNGPWQRQAMQGYTSPGAGTSVVNVRFNCPPEVTIHTLRALR